jgi:pseudouridine synthase
MNRQKNIPQSTIGPSETMKIHKYLAQAGIASRRRAEEMISEGLVQVNGAPAHIGQVINPKKDTIQFDGKKITKKQKLVYYKLHKPRGVETTCAQKEGTTTIVDIIDIVERVYPIGRLDKDSSGLILLTNDGDLANMVAHPRYEHEKEYIVEIYGKITDEELKKLADGVRIEGKKTLPAKTERIGTGRFSIVLREGKNRQIRKMIEVIGHGVKKLTRVRIANIVIQGLEEGEYRHLSKGELEQLREILSKEKPLQKRKEDINAEIKMK